MGNQSRGVTMSLWRPELTLKLTIKVVLLGLQDGRLGVDCEELKTTLQQVLSSYAPPIVPHGQGTPLSVKYDISYDAKHASEDSYSAYLSTLADAADFDTSDDRLDGKKSEHAFVVPIDVVSSEIEKLANGETVGMSTASTRGTDVTILVANPDRRELYARLVDRHGLPSSPKDVEDGRANYSFAETGSLHEVQTKPARGKHDDKLEDTGRRSTCARSWIGRGRVLILDMGAEACEYGALGEDGPHSIVTEAMFPRVDTEKGQGRPAAGHWLFHRNQKSRSPPSIGQASGGGGGDPDLTTLLYLKLSSLVVSAARTVLAPAVPASPGFGDDETVVLVPLLVFRGENDMTGSQNVEGLSEHSTMAQNMADLKHVVDIDRVSGALDSMALPNQEILVVGATHVLSEHPEVAVALRKSLATKMIARPREDLRAEITQEGFVDSARLMHEMKSLGDELTSPLLSDMGPPDWDPRVRLDVDVALAKRNTQGFDNRRIRILPVFVFCLEDVDMTSSESTRREGGGNNTLPRGRDRAARLFEDNRPFSAEIGGDAVLVLQSEGSAPVPFFERRRTEPLRLPLDDSTQAVVAGLLRGLHGTTLPDQWWPLEKQDSDLDLFWVHGFHPFAPWGFGGSVPGKLLADVAARNAVASRAAATARALSAAASALESFAQAAVPSELVVGALREPLFRGQGSTGKEWGQALKGVSEAAGLPAHVIDPVLDVHKAIYSAIVEFENALEANSDVVLEVALRHMESLRHAASQVLLEAQSAAATGHNELLWCQCTTGRVSSGAHVSWVLYLGIMLVVFYGLGRLVAAARRALLQYASGAARGPGTGTW